MVAIIGLARVRLYARVQVRLDRLDSDAYERTTYEKFTLDNIWKLSFLKKESGMVETQKNIVQIT